MDKNKDLIICPLLGFKEMKHRGGTHYTHSVYYYCHCIRYKNNRERALYTYNTVVVVVFPLKLQK